MAVQEGRAVVAGSTGQPLVSQQCLVRPGEVVGSRHVPASGVEPIRDRPGVGPASTTGTPASWGGARRAHQSLQGGAGREPRPALAAGRLRTRV